MCSHRTMRRKLTAAGAYYRRDRGVWVFPPRAHNLTPWSVDMETHASLDDAFAALPRYVSRVRQVDAFASGEGRLLIRAGLL